MPGLATQFNHNILKGQTDPRGGSASVFHDNDHRQAALSDVVSNLFGQGVNVSRIAAPNALRVHQSSNHALTGLPYSLDGESSVISQEVDNWVAAYDDPITAILGTSFHQHNREIYVTRTWYEGGGTTVIPERGRGHTMTKKEKAYHVITIRIGNEIEMNLNLFLLPNRAHKDFREFMSHQKESIMQTIRAMGWEAVMEHGFHMGAILGKIDTTSSGITDPLEVRLRNERTVAESVTFGLTSPFGLANLLQLASRCNTRVPSGTSRKPYSLVVVPHGFMSNQQLTKKEDMVAYVRGHPTCPETTIRRKLEISSYDIGPYRAVEVMPLGTHHKGGDSSEVMPSPLESSVIFAMYYTEKQKGAWLFEDDEMENAACVVCKFDTPQWKKLTRLCLQQTALATFLYRSLVDSEWPQTTPLTLEAEDALANNPTFHKLWVGDDNENVDRQSGTVAVHVIREMDNAWIRSRGQHGRIAPWWAASRVVLHDGVHCLKTEEDDTNTVYNIVYDTPDVWAHLDIDMVKLHLVFRQLYVFWTLPQFEARAESMVFVANPGPEVGEMIMQHSKLGISTNQMTETVEVSLRCYAAGFIKNPSHLLIADAVRPIAYIGGGNCREASIGGTYHEDTIDVLPMMSVHDPSDTLALFRDDPVYRGCCRVTGLHEMWNADAGGAPSPETVTPLTMFQGTVVTSSHKQRALDNGPLKLLDNPENVPVLKGLQLYCDVAENKSHLH